MSLLLLGPRSSNIVLGRELEGCVSQKGPCMQQRLTAGVFDHQDTGWRIWYFPGINDKGTIPRMQYITIRASPRWKRGENICQSQDKREVGKRGLHAATKAQPFISGRLVSTSQLISLVHNLICQLLHYFSAPKERLCIKERVVLDLLVCLQNQKQWHLLLSLSHLSFPRRPNGVLCARLLLPSR